MDCRLVKRRRGAVATSLPSIARVTGRAWPEVRKRRRIRRQPSDPGASAAGSRLPRRARTAEPDTRARAAMTHKELESVRTLPRHVEEVEVRGHIIDSLILPKILDLITASAGPSASSESRSARPATIQATPWSRSKRPTEDAAAADPAANHRPRRRADARPRLPTGGGRHGRRLSRGFLQHHQPADRNPAGQPLASKSPIRKWIAASSSIRPRARPVAWP